MSVVRDQLSSGARDAIAHGVCLANGVGGLEGAGCELVHERYQKVSQKDDAQQHQSRKTLKEVIFMPPRAILASGFFHCFRTIDYIECLDSRDYSRQLVFLGASL